MGRLHSAPRRRWLASGIATVALVAASAAYAAHVDIDGTVLNGGGTTTWDPVYDSYGCTVPDSGGVFTPVYYGGTATKPYPFSGGFGVWVGGINGQAFTDEDGKGTLGGRSLTVGPTDMGDLTVSETETALDTPSLRMLVKFHNDTSQTVHRTIALETKVGYYDVNIDRSSTGDGTWNKDDRWIIASDPGDSSLAPGTQVWYGKHAAVRVNSTDHTNGDPLCFLSDFKITVPGNGNSYLMFFAEANKRSVNSAAHNVTKFDQRHLTKALTGGLKDTVKKRIVNWDL